MRKKVNAMMEELFNRFDYYAMIAARHDEREARYALLRDEIAGILISFEVDRDELEARKAEIESELAA